MEKPNRGKDLVIKEAQVNALMQLIDKLNGLTFSQKEPYVNMLRGLQPIVNKKEAETVEESKKG